MPAKGMQPFGEFAALLGVGIDKSLIGNGIDDAEGVLDAVGEFRIEDRGALFGLNLSGGFDNRVDHPRHHHFQAGSGCSRT